MNVNPFQWAQRKIVRMLRRGILQYIEPLFGMPERWVLKSKHTHRSRHVQRPTKQQRDVRRANLASYHENIAWHRKLFVS